MPTVFALPTCAFKDLGTSRVGAASSKITLRSQSREVVLELQASRMLGREAQPVSNPSFHRETQYRWSIRTFVGVRFGSIASVPPCPRDVRLSPVSDQSADIPDRQLRATTGLMHRSKQRGQLCGLYHSITSSARASSIAGIVMPSALAVVRFTTRSNLIGCSTGISAGCVPRRTLSTSSAARRNRSGKFAP